MKFRINIFIIILILILYRLAVAQEAATRASPILDFKNLRERMVKEQIEARGVKDRRTQEALLKVERHRFVPKNLQHLAYEDMPLPIGSGQTISQPYIVALMTELLQLKGKEKVLEIGTGSGYQAAILGEMVGEVYTTERVVELAEQAGRLLDKLGYKNVHVKVAVDELGWKENAPYNAIIVTAASPSINNTLVEQLAVDGRLVIPVGSRWEQELMKLIKSKTGNRVEKLGGCRFVPLIGKDAWDE